MAEDKKKKMKAPTAAKRDVRNAKHCLINKSFKSVVRTKLKRLNEALEKGEREKIEELLGGVYSVMDKGVKRGVFKQNKANRTKRRFTALALEKTA